MHGHWPGEQWPVQYGHQSKLAPQTGKRDPGAAVCEWLKSSTNAGLTADPCAPRAGEEDEPDATFDDDFTAHCCAADDDEAAKQIQQYADRGWLAETSYAKLQSKFGNDFTVSDFLLRRQGKAMTN